VADARQVLFEVFLISHTKNDSLWQGLRAQIANCLEKRVTSRHWAHLVAGTSKRVIRLLYGPGEGTDALVVTGGTLLPTTLELEEEVAHVILVAGLTRVFLFCSLCTTSGTDCSTSCRRSRASSRPRSTWSS
jgi:hypothetical protein